MSHATPLFYSNRMITHCLEARGRYIINDPTICLQLCHQKKKLIQKREKREGELERFTYKSRYLFELILCVQ